mmetsp:Transcript_3754/g.14765  ORF Transcript_3754/g.14765 Transcript_3754/m.14765 type:complete len:450 (-) Transcript_3754:1666-3015(-)
MEGHSRRAAPSRRDRVDEASQGGPLGVPFKVSQDHARPLRRQVDDLRDVLVGRRRLGGRVGRSSSRAGNVPRHPRVRAHPHLHRRRRHRLGRPVQQAARPARRRARGRGGHPRVLGPRRRHGHRHLRGLEVQPDLRPGPALLGPWVGHQRPLRPDAPPPRAPLVVARPAPRRRRRGARGPSRGRRGGLGHDHDLRQRVRLRRRGRRHQDAHDRPVLAHGGVLARRHVVRHRLWLHCVCGDPRRPRLQGLPERRGCHVGQAGLRRDLHGQRLDGLAPPERRADAAPRPVPAVRFAHRVEQARRSRHRGVHLGRRRGDLRGRVADRRAQLRRQLSVPAALVGRYLLAHQAAVLAQQLLRPPHGGIRLLAQAPAPRGDGRRSARPGGAGAVLAADAGHARQEGAPGARRLVQRVHPVELPVRRVVVRVERRRERAPGALRGLGVVRRAARGV